MGQLVGLVVEPAIGQLLIFVHHRHGIGCLLHLGFEQLMNALVFGVRCLGRVPVIEYLPAFGWWQYLYGLHSGIRCLFQGFDEMN